MGECLREVYRRMDILPAAQPGGKNEPPSGGETRTAQLHTLIPGIPTG